MSVVMESPPLPAGGRFALVVVVGSYRDAGLTALRSPARDAVELAEVLADPGIGGFEVISLTDPGVQELREGIEEFLARRSAGELAVVYLSCHGLLDARRRLYFAATDTRKDRLAATAVPASWVNDLAEECRSRRQLLVLDCCFSGGFDRTKAGPGSRDVGLDEVFGAPEGRGRVVLTASRAAEYSYEGQELDDGSVPGSVFTSILVEGLRSGTADFGW